MPFNVSVLRCIGCSASELVETVESLSCPACGAVYPLRGNVARFVPAENYGGSFGYQWNRHRQTQLDSFTGLSLSRDRVVDATRWPVRLVGERVLEAGSGAGRFTEVLASTGAEVHSFDLSSAVDANALSNGAADNVAFYQADILDPPFRFATFDKVICLGVVQHTPDPAASFRSLTRFVKPGGHLVIDCYASNWRSVIGWKYLLRPLTKRMPKERLHALIERWTPPLVPLSVRLRRWFGRGGARLLPILQYDHWGLPPELNRQWAILDTFDMYSPAYDRPQSLRTVRGWFEAADFEAIEVRPGLNGIIGTGRKKAAPAAGSGGA